MKVLFAVSNEEISESIVKKYQREYKEIISYKNVYYFNAISKELQKDKSYDRVVISEELETFTNTQYDQIDKIIFEKLDSISDEASNTRGNDIPIILICSDRRTKSDELLVKLFGISIYDALIGSDRSIDEVCNLIHKPRSKKEAKIYYQIDADEVSYQSENENDVSEMEIQNIVAHYKRLGKNEDKFIESFDNIAAQYNDKQLRIITKFLPLNVRAVLEERSPKYQQVMSFNNAISDTLRQTEDRGQGLSGTLLTPRTKEKLANGPIVVPSSMNVAGSRKLSKSRNIPEQMVNNNTQSNYNSINNIPTNNNENTLMGQRPNNPINTPQSNIQSINQQQSNLQSLKDEVSIEEQINKPIMETTINDGTQNNFNQRESQVQDDSIFEVDPINPFAEIEKTDQKPDNTQTVQNNQTYNTQQNYNTMENNNYNSIQNNYSTAQDNSNNIQNDNNYSAIQNEPIIPQEEQSISIEQSIAELNDMVKETPVVEQVKRGRGRPRKNPVSNENEVPRIKRGRGRPRKNPVSENNTLDQEPGNEELSTLPGIDMNDFNPAPVQNQETYLPGFEDNNNVLPESNTKQNEDPFADISAGISDEELFSNVSSDLNENDDPFADVLPGVSNNNVSSSTTSNAQNTDDLFSDVLPGVSNNDVSANTMLNSQNSNDSFSDVVSEQPKNEDPFADISSENQQNNDSFFNTISNDNQNDYINENFDNAQQNYNEPNNDFTQTQGQTYDSFNNNQISEMNQQQEQYENQYTQNNYQYESIDLSNLLTPDKKIATFVGTSKNGTSFIVNNIAEYISSTMGINTAILDTTKNRNSYYIYTKNEEQLRNIAKGSIEGLTQGTAQGISVNKNLTVYTSLPDDNESIGNVDKILETLLQKHSLILIDTDFDTPEGYFKQAQETYLVQTYDILTIQPLTAFLNRLKSKNILDEKKLKIILNKVVRIRGINEKTIIGGMAYYNDPEMSFMNELFDRTLIKYVPIPFEEEIYAKYLQGIIECEVTLKGYSKEFMQTLRQLANMIYSYAPNGMNNNSYAPPSAGRNVGNNFSSNMNNTLDQMRRNY